MSTASESASKPTADELSLRRREPRYPKLMIGVAALSLTMLGGALSAPMNSQMDQGRWRSMICVTMGAIVLSGVAITFGRNRMRAVFRAPLTGLFAGMVTAVIVGGVAAAVEGLATGSVPTASLRAAGLAGLPAASAIGVGIGLIGWAVFRLIPYRTPGNTAQGKRRRFQFGLRTLLFAVFVVALVLWIGIPIQRDYQQHQRAVSQLVDAGAHIDFEAAEAAHWLESVVEIPVDPRWYANVRSVELSRATDSDLRTIGQLTELRRLGLGNVDFTGDGLKHLASLSELESLGIGDSSVDDRALAELALFSKLETLELQNVSLSGAGLSHLPHLPVRCVMLYRVNVTDADLEHLSACTDIESLTLCRTSVGDAGLAHLTQLPSLRFLHLGGPTSPVTDWLA